MSDQFLAEIRIFTANFAPVGWATCDGQLVPISQNPALFSLVGTTYGGNGTSTFALPDMQGSAALSQGQGPGLTLRDLGETGGEQTVTLLESEIPAHLHNAVGDSSGGQSNPQNGAWGSAIKGRGAVYAPPASSDPSHSTSMSPSALSISGGNLPHNNLSPYLVLNFIIALSGIFPARS